MHTLLAIVLFIGQSTEASPVPAQLEEESVSIRPTGTGGSEEHITAADVLRALQRRRPENPVIHPVGYDPLAQQQGHLFPEGHMLVDKIARLIRSADGPHDWMLAFAADEGLNPIPVLPNSMLEPMVTIVESAADPVAFEVSAEATVFREQNYLLVRFAKRAGASTVASLEPADAAKDKLGDDAPPTDPPLAGQSNPGQADDESVEDVLAQLQAQAPAQDPVTMVGVSPASDPVPSPPGLPIVFPEGTAIVDRPGRIIASGDWATFVFESDQGQNVEPAVELLPNTNLELMLRRAGETELGLIFRVSGMLTTFQGNNYLLVRQATQEPPSGNFRK